MTIKGTEQHLQGPACIKITVPVLYIKMYNTWESISQQKVKGPRDKKRLVCVCVCVLEGYKRN